MNSEQRGKGKRLKRTLKQEGEGFGKSNKTIVIFPFSHMADKIFEVRERNLNRYSNIPQPFSMGDIVITQPAEREILLAQIAMGATYLCISVPIGRWVHIPKAIRRGKWPWRYTVGVVRVSRLRQDAKDVCKVARGGTRWGRSVKRRPACRGEIVGQWCCV